MTLSRFLRDYLYIPLGGNRKSPLARWRNLLIVMVLGGVWHGAGWTFLVWGGLHGAFLIVNHAWRGLVGRGARTSSALYRFFAWLLTFLCVVVAWVFFRAASLGDAFVIVRGMLGLNGIVLPTSYAAMFPLFGLDAEALGIRFGALRGVTNLHEMVVWFGCASVIAFALPNSQTFMRRYAPVLGRVDYAATVVQWRPRAGWCAVFGVVLFISIAHITRVSEFLYFQF